MKRERRERPLDESVAVARRRSAGAEQPPSGLVRDWRKSQPGERIVVAERVDTQFERIAGVTVDLVVAGARLRELDLAIAAQPPDLGSPAGHHLRRRLPR